MKPSVLFGLLLITLSAALIVTRFLGKPSAFLLLAAVSITCVIALLWKSLSSLGGEGELSLEEALALAAPTPAEEQKRAVLRALKDLEYELKVGKIDRQDYEEASTFYRNEARRFIALSDASLGDRRQLAEARFQERLVKENLVKENLAKNNLAEGQEQPSASEDDA